MLSTLSQSIVTHTDAYDINFVGSTGSILLAGRTVIVNGETPGTDFPVGVNLRREVEQFAKCCITNTIPDASGRSVRHTMAVIEAARLSAERNTVVELTKLA